MLKACSESMTTMLEGYEDEENGNEEKMKGWRRRGEARDGEEGRGTRREGREWRRVGVWEGLRRRRRDDRRREIRRAIVRRRELLVCFVVSPRVDNNIFIYY